MPTPTTAGPYSSPSLANSHSQIEHPLALMVNPKGAPKGPLSLPPRAGLSQASSHQHRARAPRLLVSCEMKRIVPFETHFWNGQCTPWAPCPQPLPLWFPLSYGCQAMSSPPLPDPMPAGASLPDCHRHTDRQTERQTGPIAEAAHALTGCSPSGRDWRVVLILSQLPSPPGTQSVGELPACPTMCPLGRGVHKGSWAVPGRCVGEEGGRLGQGPGRQGLWAGGSETQRGQGRLPWDRHDLRRVAGDASGPLSSLACVQTKTSVSKRQVSAAHAHTHRHAHTRRPG